MYRGIHDTTLAKKVEKELIDKFNASKAADRSIVITMNVDNVPLIITPDWTFGQRRFPELANMFTVYVDVPKGRAAVPHMHSDSLLDLANKLVHYSGINLDEDGGCIRLMKMSDEYEMPYDMYDEDMMNKVLEMQGKKVKNDVFVDEDGELIFAFM